MSQRKRQQQQQRPADARQVIADAAALPEAERRQVEKFGQAGAGKSLGGLAAGGGSGFGLFWILNKLGLFSALDLTDPNELAGVTAVLTVVSAWLGRVLNELRKDHPEMMRKIGLGSTSAAALLACLLVAGCGKGLSIGSVTLVPAAETPAKQWAVWSGVFNGARAALETCVRDEACRGGLSRETLVTSLKVAQLGQVTIEQTERMLDDPDAADFVDAAIVIVRDATLEMMAALSPEVRANLAAFLDELPSGKLAFEEAFPNG